MGYLFVTESSAKVSFEENTFSVRNRMGISLRYQQKHWKVSAFLEIHK